MFVGSVSSLEAFKQNKRFAIVHKKYKVIHIYKYMLKLNIKDKQDTHFLKLSLSEW